MKGFVVLEILLPGQANLLENDLLGMLGVRSRHSKRSRTIHGETERQSRNCVLISRIAHELETIGTLGVAPRADAGIAIGTAVPTIGQH